VTFFCIPGNPFKKLMLITGGLFSVEGPLSTIDPLALASIKEYYMTISVKVDKFPVLGL